MGYTFVSAASVKILYVNILSAGEQEGGEVGGCAGE